MELLAQISDRISQFVWGPWTLGLFLLVGGYYSVRTGFFQLFGCKIWLKETVGSMLRKEKKQRDRNRVSPFQALSTALAATIGTGSIAGVATALFFGGPGAIFWMWVSALLGMMTSFAEKTLAVRYRARDGKGRWKGGAMAYIERGLGIKWLAMAFAAICVVTSFGIGNLVQSNSIATALHATFGLSPIMVGVACAVLTGLVIMGGLSRINAVTEKLVPFMAIFFLLGGGVVILVHASALPEAFRQIFEGAFGLRAAASGSAGYGLAATLHYGIARGVFTNEAGLGASSMVHATAEVREPAVQGMWGIFEVFTATLVVCTVTALVLLTSGVYSETVALGELAAAAADYRYVIPAHLLGAPLSVAAFGTVFGRFGGIFVSICILLFAFSTLLGWSYYGEQGLEYLTGGGKYTRMYRILFLCGIVLGSVGDLGAIWQAADTLNALLAFPNLIVLLLLSPEVIRLWRAYQERKDPGCP